MKITDAKVIVCSPGRNFVTLKLLTEDGLTGVGDATLNGRELAVATYLQEHVVPLLIGAYCSGVSSAATACNRERERRRNRTSGP